MTGMTAIDIVNVAAVKSNCIIVGGSSVIVAISIAAENPAKSAVVNFNVAAIGITRIKISISR